MQKSNSLLFLLVILTGIYGCKEGVVYEENLKIEKAIWERDKKASFEFSIEDSTAEYEVYLNFRHGGDYPYQNIYLFTKTVGPSGNYRRDTAQMLLANNKGRWLGKGIGDIFDYQFLFKKGILFPEKGTYFFEIEQAMRTATLENVTDIGISVKQPNQ